ncbi:hypothetical protein UFOVP1033_77 [uncultured Caudovirales phage]|uniref:Uncharacterized protein n=1 Tax=uncultured Caudovirales phage TaxID=2100421 RepID=A0A6J5SZA0_9CAUD|nr:hypothetical protein UFOVP1033_77 [uncultured Caudovirales phage]CAB4220798.1 hypothetical protein UFOVP1631_77 [uncultured Caudovirales phage]
MAKKSIPNLKIEGKVAQMSDFSKEGQKAAEKLAFDVPLKTKAAEFIASGTGTPSQQEAVKNVAPHLTDKPSSLNQAASNRVAHITAGATNPSLQKEGENLPGSGWYFQHNADVTKVAHEYGVHPDVAITASAVMSPQNSPSNEKEAVSALLHAHRSGTITIPHEVASQLNSSKGLQKAQIQVNPEHVGVPVHASQLHPAVLAALSEKKVREQLPDHTVNLEGIAKGGSRENIAKAIDVIRGNTPESTAIDPHSSPKVYSYRDAIKHAVPGTPHHMEYMMRAADIGDKLRGDVGKGQGMLDYHNLRGSNEGMLSSTRTTAEDTWMNSISHGQKNEIVPGTDTNIMKTAGSLLGYTGKKKHEGVSVDSDTRIGTSAVQHAANNAATIKAGTKLQKNLKLDYSVPSTLVQESAWIPARRAGNKDKAFNKSQALEKTSRAKEFQTGSYKQGELF